MADTTDVANESLEGNNFINSGQVQVGDSYLEEKILESVVYIKQVKRKKPDVGEILKMLKKTFEELNDLDIQVLEEKMSEMLHAGVLQEKGGSYAILKPKASNQTLVNLLDDINDIDSFLLRKIEAVKSCFETKIISLIHPLEDKIVKQSLKIDSLKNDLKKLRENIMDRECFFSRSEEELSYQKQRGVLQ